MWGVKSASYRGSLVLIPGRSGHFSLVNTLDMEQYLRGVVPLELGVRARTLIEATKAQAVVARTYAYRRILERRGAAYDMLPTVADQVYGGARAEDQVADEAIQETRGQILCYAGEPIVAYYHSTCGGRTANIEEVWDKPALPYLRSVRDVDTSGQPYCRDSRYAQWSCTWDRSLLSTLIARYGGKVGCGNSRLKGAIQGISVISRGGCGRVERLVVQGSQENAEFCGDQTRRALRRNQSGHPLLPSAWFDVEVKGRTVTAYGKGYGHGVGLCQMGALGRAREGHSYIEILTAYYAGVELAEVGSKPRSASRPQ